jgi:hypothetical protein
MENELKTITKNGEEERKSEIERRKSKIDAG